MKILKPVIVCLVVVSAFFPGRLRAQARSATVIDEGASLYDRPSPLSTVKIPVPAATRVRVLEDIEGWYVVRIDEQVGWMKSTALRLGAATVSASSSLSTAQTLKSASRASASSGRTYTRGPRGGCYYVSGSGKKVYVDRSMC